MSSLSCDVKATGHLYQYLQIELTNRCNLSCQTCLHSVNNIVLQEDDLNSTALQRLQPSLQHTASVHLQGWGEAMLLANLPERIHWFKAQGCKVSFTTNGSFMTKQQAADLITSGLDSITFSMAGATASLQDKLRGSGTYAKLMQNMLLLQRVKQQLNSVTPTVAVSYLLTKESIRELPLAVKKCRPLGVCLFAGVHLTHPATGKQESMHLWSASKKPEYSRLIRRAHWHAFWGGMRLQLPAFQPDLTPICNKNPIAGCFIAADGSVAPCVFLYPPPSHTKGCLPVPRKRMGSLYQDSLDTIWQEEEYRIFRRKFQQRITIYEKEMTRVGCGMDAFAKLDQTRNRIKKAFLEHPVPHCCKNCPKMEGF